MSEVTEHPVKLGGVHHAAYRCKDAKETVEWYEKVLGMEYTSAFSEDHVPSTGEYDPYMHVFLDAGNGNILAFFELPNQKDMGRDENTPIWVQHLAFKVADEDALIAAKAHIEGLGIDDLAAVGDVHQAVGIGIVNPADGKLFEDQALVLVEHFLAGLVQINPTDADRARLKA